MAVMIDENVLFFVVGAMFIPVFIFSIKMIIEFGNLKTKYDALKQEMENRFERQDETNERVQKSLDLLNQFSWGRSAKSVPAFLSDIDETEEHKRSPNVGIFREPDSSETQDEKDRKNKNRNNNSSSSSNKNRRRYYIF